jgi:SM-20-related protein
MPPPEFFKSLGLFVVDKFLDAGYCAQLCSEVLVSPTTPGRVGGNNSMKGGWVDESRRSVLCADVSKTTAMLLGSRLAQLKPALEEHFQVLLADCDGPHLLRYGQGNFYSPHRDVDASSPEHLRGREISIIVFLNPSTQDPALEGGYGGGDLTFYGLLQGERWNECGFSFEASPGLLVAFRPDLLHEVRPVTFGQRLTVAAWFNRDSSQTLRAS